MRSILLAALALSVLGCSEPAGVTPDAAPEAAAPTAPESAAQPPSEPADQDVPAAVIAPVDVAALIAGKWQSIEDPRATIIVTEDGGWSDRYEGEPDQREATWEAMWGADAAKAEPKQTFTPNHSYLQVVRDDGAYYYELGAVDEDNLEMFYVGRGNRLAFRRAD